MDQYLNNRQNEILWELLANPADNGQLHNYDLQQLVDEFPQSGILRAMLAHAGNGSDLKHAAAYYNPRLLHKLINDPESLPVVSPQQIAGYKNGKGAYQGENYFNIGTTAEPETVEPLAEHYEVENRFEAEPEVDTPEAATTFEQSAQPEVPPAVPVVELPSSAYQEELPPLPETDMAVLAYKTGVQLPVDEEAVEILSIVDEHPSIIEETKIEDEIPASIAAEMPVAQPVITQVKDDEDIEDEVFDEIVGIEHISFTGSRPYSKQEQKVEEAQTADRNPIAEKNLLAELKSNEADINFETEKWIIGSIAATDYFMFDNSIADQKGADKPTETESIPAAPVASNVEDNVTHDAETVSKYNDEKMPFTFMWWLDKTRKEYAATYQPYTAPIAPPMPVSAPLQVRTDEEKEEQATDALQQQYFENIFHDKSLLDLENAPLPDAPEVKRKEDVIIEKFIKEEPQIRPPSINKLDNENKAKKSSEDKNEMVSETLAQIYSDQMLYHKAIATYKKLISKFPEKSRYFAHQIELLEKKTN